MSTDALTITCSPQELVFLAGLLGADTLVGVEDPFWGWLAEEVEEAWEKAKVELADRRFIELQPDDQVVMDVTVAALVGACAFPKASFLLTVGASQEATTHVLYLAEGIAVEQAQEGEQYRLTALDGADAILQRIETLLGLHDQVAPGVPGQALRDESLAQARDKATQGDLEAARAVLEQAGLPAETAAVLTEDLAHSIRDGALVAIAPQEQSWEVAGLGFLEGKNGLWRLRTFTREETNWVEVIPTSAEEAREAIRRMMNRVLPEPLPDSMEV